MSMNDRIHPMGLQNMLFHAPNGPFIEVGRVGYCLGDGWYMVNILNAMTGEHVVVRVVHLRHMVRWSFYVNKAAMDEALARYQQIMNPLKKGSV